MNEVVSNGIKLAKEGTLQDRERDSRVNHLAMVSAPPRLMLPLA